MDYQSTQWWADGKFNGKTVRLDSTVYIFNIYIVHIYFKKSVAVKIVFVFWRSKR